MKKTSIFEDFQSIGPFSGVIEFNKVTKKLIDLGYSPYEDKQILKDSDIDEYLRKSALFYETFCEVEDQCNLKYIYTELDHDKKMFWHMGCKYQRKILPYRQFMKNN